MPARLPVYLFVLPWGLQHRGGVNQVVLSLAHEMRQAGNFEPVVLVADWHSPQPRWGEYDGIRTVSWRLRDYQAGMGWRAWLAYHRWLLRMRPAFRRFCREQQVTVVNAHYPGATAFSLHELCGVGLPLLLSFHGSDVTTLAATPAQWPRWRRLLQAVRAVTTCSQDLAGRLHQMVGADVALTPIHNGVDAPAFRANAVSPAILASRTIVSVGKYDSLKGQDVLLQALAELAPDFPDLRLALAGAPGAALPALQAQAAAAGLAERVQFLLNVPHQEIAGLMAQAEMFVLPSRREAFGMVLLEAGAFSLPVVASAVGGVPEIIRDGENGRLVPPDDAAALARTLREMLEAREMAASLGRTLRAEVDQQFSWRAAYRAYLGLLA